METYKTFEDEVDEQVHTGDDRILIQGKRELKCALEDIHENRCNAEDDLVFARLGEQWPEDVKSKREADDQPCLTVNTLPMSIRHVVNEIVSSEPGILVHGVDSVSDPKTAEVIGGIIKHIEYQSNAKAAYSKAVDNQVTCGFGFLSLAIDYESPYSFDQCIKIKRIPDPLSVIWDHSSREFDASDWNFAFITEEHTKRSFEMEFPGFEPSSLEFDAFGDTLRIEDRDVKTYRVAEYWYKDPYEFDLIEFMDRASGQKFTMSEDRLEEDEILADFIRAGSVEVRRRKVKTHKVLMTVISGKDVLVEPIEWPGMNIPIAPVWGEEVFARNNRYFHGLIRDVKDAQRMTNYWTSQAASTVSLAPKAQWLVDQTSIPPDQIDVWKTANTEYYPFLVWDSATGGSAPARIDPPRTPIGELSQREVTHEDKQRIMGLFNASIGADGPELTGRAIMARQKKGDMSVSHFNENLKHALTYLGKCMIEAIPSVYGAQQQIKILGDDQSEKIIQLTNQQADPKNGIHNLSLGTYDVVARSGPGFATQREETRAFLQEVISTQPEAATLFGDMLVDTFDVKDKEKVVRRLKLMLPEHILAAEVAHEEGKNPEAAGIAARAQQMLQEMQKKLEEQQQKEQLLTIENAKLKAMMSVQNEQEAVNADLFKTEMKNKEADHTRQDVVRELQNFETVRSLKERLEATNQKGKSNE